MVRPASASVTARLDQGLGSILTATTKGAERLLRWEQEEINEGDRQGQRHAGEQGGRQERAGQGGEGEVAAVVDANHQGQDDDAANGEKIWTTAKDK